jgi:HSP20 family protein
MEAFMDMKSITPWRRPNGDAAQTGSLDGPGSFLSLHRQVNRLFDDFFRDFDSPVAASSFATHWPPLEVVDEDKETRIIAELPGLEEKDIDITLREGTLTIKGEKSRKSETAAYSERWHGKFMRAIELGPDIDPDMVKASFDKGVLTIRVGKRASAKASARKIAISRN